VAGTCATGLSCKPGPNAYGSRAQFSKLSQDGTAATADTAVVGTCSKAAACSTAYGPCGKAAGELRWVRKYDGDGGREAGFGGVEVNVDHSSNLHIELAAVTAAAHLLQQIVL
jgi:hypothetical protein